MERENKTTIFCSHMSFHSLQTRDLLKWEMHLGEVYIIISDLIFTNGSIPAHVPKN